jgi:hypothetical protein
MDRPSVRRRPVDRPGPGAPGPPFGGRGGSGEKLPGALGSPWIRAPGAARWSRGAPRDRLRARYNARELAQARHLLGFRYESHSRSTTSHGLDSERSGRTSGRLHAHDPCNREGPPVPSGHEAAHPERARCSLGGARRLLPWCTPGSTRAATRDERSPQRLTRLSHSSSFFLPLRVLFLPYPSLAPLDFLPRSSGFFTTCRHFLRGSAGLRGSADEIPQLGGPRDGLFCGARHELRQYAACLVGIAGDRGQPC